MQNLMWPMLGKPLSVCKNQLPSYGSAYIAEDRYERTTRGKRSCLSPHFHFNQVSFISSFALRRRPKRWLLLACRALAPFVFQVWLYCTLDTKKNKFKNIAHSKNNIHFFIVNSYIPHRFLSKNFYYIMFGISDIRVRTSIRKMAKFDINRKDVHTQQVNEVFQRNHIE